MNEACSLIRAATANEDAQINFGVVLNEAMEDEVKITVIATGFQRDSLPQITRRQVDVSEPVCGTMRLPRRRHLCPCANRSRFMKPRPNLRRYRTRIPSRSYS